MNWWEVAPAANAAPSGNWWEGAPAAQPSAPQVAPDAAGFAPRSAREADPTKEQKQAAYNEMASGVRERQGTVAKYADTAVRGLARAVPVMDDIAALGDTLTGGGSGGSFSERYSDNLMRQRAMNEVDDSGRPIASYGSQIAGGVAALPTFGLAANTAKGGAALGVGYGAAYGFGSGDGLEDRAKKAAGGGLVGGLVGGVLGKVMPGAPEAQKANPVVDAAERQGITVPTAVASDSQSVQRAGQAVKAVPFAGERMTKALVRTQEEATAALDNLASGLGAGDAASAGTSAVSSIKDWVTGKSKDALKTAYEAVDKLVNPNVTTPLSRTQGEVASILAERQAQRISDPGKAVSFVADAVTDAQGLTYEGIKGLRTRIGEMLDSPSMLPSETSRAELRRIYSALTKDLGNAVQNAGGAQGKAAWERANTLNKAVAARREELAKIVGEGADAAPEKVFARLQQMASTSASADANLLAKARNAIGAEWGEVSSAIVANMGRDANGAFTPDRFVTAYGKLSDAGKSILFDKTTRQALDDINTISARMQSAFKRYGNPSGTAQNAGWAASGAGLMSNPPATIASVIGGNALAAVLASPATASSMAKWSRAYEAAVRKPTAGTISVLTAASRNFATNIAEKTGVNVTGEQIMRALSGPSRSHGETDQEKRN